MIKKNINIRLTSYREASEEQFFDSLLYGDDEPLDEDGEGESESGPVEMYSEGELYVSDERVIIAYEETELTGMEGSQTQVRFERNDPNLVVMMRNGTVNTVLVFEEGKRHICTYQTEYMPFEICVFTRSVKNTLLTDGRIELDYTVEIRGAQAEQTHFVIEISEDIGAKEIL